VKWVKIRRKSGNYQRTSGNSKLWYRLVDLEPGRHTFLVRAMDHSGNLSRSVRVTVIRK